MKAQVLIFMISMLTLIGCAPGKSANNAASTSSPSVPFVNIPATGPYVPTQTGVAYDPGNTFTYGGTTNFTFDSVDVYRDYTQRYVGSLTELTNVKLNLNLQRYGQGYGGTVTLRYALNGQLFEGFFTGGHEPVAAQYNIWFANAGKNVWHGFFEDFMGAIVVVIDGVTDLGDGAGPTDKVSGSIWYKNFAVGPGYGPHPPTYCWFVSYGPYDCRAWSQGWGVNTKAAVNPDNGFTRLGTFSDMPVTSAFSGMAL